MSVTLLRARARARSRRLAAVLAAMASLVVVPCARGADVRGVADRSAVQLSGGALLGPAAPLVELAASRFVSDLVEIGVRQEGAFAAGSGPRDWHLATTAFMDLHLLRDPKPRVTPFLGLVAGAAYDDRAAAATLGPEAGVSILVGEHAFVAARWQFRWTSEPVGGLAQDEHVLLLGFGLHLGGGASAELARAEASAARAEEAAAKAEEAVARLERAVERLERTVDAYAAWFEEQLRK